MTTAYKLMAMALVSAMLCQGTSKTIPPAAIETPQKGMILTVSVEKSAISVNSELWLTVVLENTSGHKIFINTEKGHPAFGYAIDVTDEKGAPVADTTLGHMRKRDISVDPDTGKPIIWVSSDGPEIFVDPGKTLTDKVELTRLFNMQQPGRYSIRVTRPDTSSAANNMEVKNWPMAESNVVTVTVSQ